MKCPRCQTPDLKPTMIEEYLPAMSCETCEGSLVSLLYYRHWAETQKPATATPPSASADVETSDTTKALVCPKCARIMAKYKVTGAVANRLDVCGLCDEAWLDRGEWELLEALQLSHKMPSIFTEVWQRRIRHEQSEETRRTILRRTLGDAAAQRVEDFRVWLNEQRHKPDVMAYLYRD
jgi:Zn-finger nucleic acid-binding protein